MQSFRGSIVEDAALAWLEAVGYAALHDVRDDNEWPAVYQFTLAEGQHTRRPDAERVMGDVA